MTADEPEIFTVRFIFSNLDRNLPHQALERMLSYSVVSPALPGAWAGAWFL